MKPVPFFFFFFKLACNCFTVLVPAVQQSGSTICIHIYRLVLFMHSFDLPELLLA